MYVCVCVYGKVGDQLGGQPGCGGCWRGWGTWGQTFARVQEAGDRGCNVCVWRRGGRSFQVGNRGVGVCEGPNVRWRIGAWVIAYGVWEVAVGDEHWSLDKCGAEEEDRKESLKSRTDK